jgi:hypothetical protein
MRPRILLVGRASPYDFSGRAGTLAYAAQRPGGSGRHRIADALTICHRQSDVETIPPCKLALSGTAALSSTPTGRKLALFHTAGPPPFGRIGRAHQSPACSDAVRRFLGSVKCEV